MITIYTLPDCPRCEQVKEHYTRNNVTFTVRSMDDPEALSDLRFNGCYAVVAPIIQVDENYYTYDEISLEKIENEETPDMEIFEGNYLKMKPKTTITDAYKKIMEDIFEVKDQRGLMYRKEPKDIVPIETLEHLAYLKAVRGMESLNLDKKIDEYKDLVNYAVFVLERLYKEKEKLNPALALGDV